MLAGIAVVVLAAILILFKIRKLQSIDRGLPSTTDHSDDLRELDQSSERDVQPLGYYEELSPDEDLDLSEYQEIENSDRLRSTISQLIPATATVFSGLASSAAKNATQGAYQVLLKSGQELTKSKAGPDLFRGISHLTGHKETAGHVNLRKIDGTASELATNTGAVAGVMAVASMIVGQYYMTEINGKLSDINQAVDRIQNFQNTALLSEVRSLIRETKHIAQYNDEIMASQNERMDAREHVRELEEKAGKLLDQINALILPELIDVKNFSEYEQHTHAILPLSSAQSALLSTLQELSRLVIVLSNSEVSPERASATYIELSGNAEKVRAALRDWHSKEDKILKVDVSLARRQKTGFKGAVSHPVAKFKPEFGHEKISQDLVRQIKSENSNVKAELPDTHGFEEPVQLLIRDDHVYYRIPSSEQVAGSNMS